MRQDHVETGEQFGVQESAYRTMASTLKVPIGVTLFDQVDKAHVDLEAMHSFKPADMRMGGWLTEPLVGRKGHIQLSTYTVIDAALRVSDNAAWLKMVDILGGIEPVGAFLASHQLAEIRCTHSIYDTSLTELLRSWGYEKKVPPSRLTAAERQILIERYYTEDRDACTPRGMADLLEKLHRGDLLSQDSTKLILGIMQRCETSQAKLRALLPPNVVVMDKTGSIGDILSCDIGIITLPNDRGTIVVALFARAPDAGSAKLDSVAAHVGRLVYDCFVARRQ